MSRRLDIFKDFLDGFETEELRKYCEDMIELMPEYNFVIPSSTSMRFHNATQCQPGGHCYHVIMSCTIINYLLGLEYMQEKFPEPKRRDCLRIAMCLHDSQKTGGTDHTVHEHPLLASKWIQETHPEHDIKDGLKKYIGRLSASHSGSWTTSKYSDVVLPKPENDEQFLIHLCDYLGSRSNLDMIYTTDQIEAVRSFAPLPTFDEFKIEFGKYKGMTLGAIRDIDKEYLVWLRDKSSMELREPLKSLLEEMN